MGRYPLNCHCEVRSNFLLILGGIASSQRAFLAMTISGFLTFHSSLFTFHSSQFNSHLFQRLPDGSQQSMHVGWENASDAADAETIGFADFTRVDNVVLLV